MGLFLHMGSVLLHLRQDSLQKILGGGVGQAIQAGLLGGLGLGGGESGGLSLCLGGVPGGYGGLVTALDTGGLHGLAVFLGGPFFAGFLRQLCVFLPQMVDGAEDAEQHEGHQHELDNGVDDGAPINVDGRGQIQGAVFGVPRLENGIEPVQMGVAEPLRQDEVDHGLENAPAHGVDDGGEGAADDHTHGHVHHVAAVDEFFVFTDEGLKGMNFHENASLIHGGESR